MHPEFIGYNTELYIRQQRKSLSISTVLELSTVDSLILRGFYFLSDVDCGPHLAEIVLLEANVWTATVDRQVSAVR